jgi:hypothetical protein
LSADWTKGDNPSPVIKTDPQKAIDEIRAAAYGEGAEITLGKDLGPIKYTAAPDDPRLRVRRIAVGERDLLDAVLFNLARRPDVVMRLTGPKLPPDYVVNRVFHDPFSRCFMFVVQHPSFSPIHEGDVVPPLEGEWRWEVVDARVQVATHLAGPDRVRVQDAVNAALGGCDPTVIVPIGSGINPNTPEGRRDLIGHLEKIIANLKAE